MRNVIDMEQLDEMINNRQQGLFAKKKDKNDKIRELLTSDGVDADTIEKFLEWFNQNQKAWTTFKRYASQALLNKRKVGAKAVAERVRWDSEVESLGRWDFKVNNNYVAYLARLYNANVKQEYFETRETRGLKAA